MRVGKQAIVNADPSPLPAPVPSMACYCTIQSRALLLLRSARQPQCVLTNSARIRLHSADHSWEDEASPRDIQIDLMAQSTHRQRLNEASIR